MNGTPCSPVKEALTYGDNEFIGDLRAWEIANSGDNSERLQRLRRNLRQARRRELTARQEEMIRLRYDEGLSVGQISQQLGVCRSTVSRTLSRGREKLRKYLQYSL